jgi:valyl-tRNA synthetase
MPFLTEEIWQRVAPLAGARGETISLQPYPQPDPTKEDAEAEAQIRWLKDFVLGVRRIRGEINLLPTQALPLVLQDADAADRALLDTFRPMIMRLARVQSIELLAPDKTAPQAAAALLGNLKILVPLAGLIDVERELQRLDKEIGRLTQDHERVQAKLGNSQFVSQAPAEIVAKERARAQALETALAELTHQRQRLGTLG